MQLYKDRLKHILGLGAILQPANQIAEQSAFVAGVQLLESIRVALSVGLHHFFVGQSRHPLSAIIKTQTNRIL